MNRLTERYKPQQLNEFIGLDDPKRIMCKWLASPYPIAFLYVGESGTGKTTMAQAVSRAVGADPAGPNALYSYIAIPSQKCNVEAVARIQERILYTPWADFWVIQVDEADQMSSAAQLAFLSLLDNIPERVVIIFTCNDTSRFEDRFLSRCMIVKFSNYGLNGAGSKFLETVWDTEYQAPSGKLFEDARPNFARIMKDSKNNIRAALMHLESQLMSA